MSEYKFVPSEVLMSSGHQEEDLALKSPVIIDTVGLRVLMSLKAAHSLTKMSQIYACVGLGNGKLHTLSSFYCYHSFLRQELLSNMVKCTPLNQTNRHRIYSTIL